MGLFDDILKKPQEKAPVDPLVQSGGGTPPPGSGTGSSGGHPPQDDVAQVSPAPIFIQKTTETSLFDTAPRVDMSDLRIQENTPVVTSQAESNTDTLLVSMPTEITQENTPSTLVPAEEMHPLFGSPETSTIEALESTPLTSPVTPPEKTPNDSLFNLGEDTTVVESTSESFAPILEEQKVEKILHPKEFLERSIESIDSMIADIDMAYDKKVSEAESYAQEKERLADLEKDTYDEASKLSEEKDHALHVRKLLDKELGSNTKKDPEGESLMSSLQSKEAIVPPLVEATMVSDAPQVPTVESSVTPEEAVVPAPSGENFLLDLSKAEGVNPEAPVPTKKVHKEKTEDTLPGAN